MKKILTLISIILFSLILTANVNAADKDILNFSYLDENNQTISESIDVVENLIITTNNIRFKDADITKTYNYPDIRNNTTFKLIYQITNDNILVISGGLINTSKHSLNVGDLVEIENKELKVNGNVIELIKSGSYQFNFITLEQNQLFSDLPFAKYYVKNRYSINQSTSDFVHGLDLLVNKSDLEWIENTIYTITVPDGFNLLYKNNSYEEPNPRMEYLTNDNIELKAIRTSTSTEVFEITINDVYVGRLVNDYTFKFYTDDLTTVNIYYADSGKWVLREAFIATKNATFDTVSTYLDNYKNVNHELLDHQVFKFLITPVSINKYFDEENDIAIANTDRITSNMKIYQKVGYSENTSINITYQTNVPGNENLDLLHTYDLKDYYESPGDTWKLIDLNYVFPTLEFEGYLFSHWEKFENNQWVKADLRYENTGNLILKAIFVDESEPIKVKIDYGSGIQLFEILPGQSIPYNQLEIPAKISKRFVGFSFHPSHPNDSEHSHFIDLENEVFVSDKRVYAIYEDVIYYNVTFDVDGGVYIPPMKVRANTNNFAGELPEAVKSKHIFLGWFLDPELTIPAPLGKVNKHDLENTIFYDITLYASYHDNGSKVYFHTNTSEFEISPIVITKGQSVNISNPPKRNGYIFEGWYLDELKTIEYLGEPIEVDEVNLYAKWSVDDDGNGDNGGNGGNGDTGGNQDATKDNTQLFTTILVVAGVVGLVIIIGNNRKPKRRRRR